ncbi:MAG: HAD-IIA family hydrolase [Anaerolineales bacterium]|nr:HAD-IIA family hydrolase [Chloroflexota bacterium]MBL6981620.1 HAD-IIA family hydrolase [Anaerolineales bacterium]
MNKTWLKDIECFLFDMDGTIYLGGQLLPGARDLVAYLREQSIPYYFLTNNSSRSKKDYAKKLCGLRIHVSENEIFTSGEATAIYLQKEIKGNRVYVVGTPSLEKEFEEFGFELEKEKPDVVVLGFDTTLTYDKIWKLCDFVRDDIPYIATHPDINCPTETGFMPDIGAMMAMIASSTGRHPDVIVGKPHKPIVDAILEKTGFEPAQLAMVGDRLYTDIALGKAGIKTILVLSGEAKREDIPSAPVQPNLVLENVGGLLVLLKDLL